VSRSGTIICPIQDRGEPPAGEEPVARDEWAEAVADPADDARVEDVPDTTVDETADAAAV